MSALSRLRQDRRAHIALAVVAVIAVALLPLFRPPLGEMMALSPQGARVAYTTQASGNLAIVIMNLDHPGPKKTLGSITVSIGELKPMRVRPIGVLGCVHGAISVATAVFNGRSILVGLVVASVIIF